jgi:ferric-dicitrate binding protein FerR (iron transport regulator)
MSSNTNSKSNESIDRQSEVFFKGGKFQWKRDKGEIWLNVNAAIDKSIGEKQKVFKLRRNIMAMAASLLLIIGLGSFIRFYSVSVEVPAGRHQAAMLPDGSKVYLNAQSSLKYYPHWWRFSRIVRFEGEALFEVEEGNRFKVVSQSGRTEVLGTRFNVYAREQEYSVTCLSGSVKVSSTKRESTVLLPGSRASILPSGQIQVEQEVDTSIDISWKDQLFKFSGTPIALVFREIERQYGISIELNVNSGDRYTGNFNRTLPLNQTLEVVCRAMGFTYTKKNGNTYFITQSNE